MIERTKRKQACLALMLMLAACVPSTTKRSPPVAPPVPTPTPVISSVGIENVMGHDARALEALFGKPDLDVREGTARKLQFASQICVLDTYLYSPRGGGDAIVTHVDARLPDGRDMDRASCVAALSRREQAR